MNIVRTSKFISLVLRHQPDLIGLTLDDAGWVYVDVLLDGMARHGHRITRADLERVVATSDKRRFALSEDGRRIRASQGHSVAVELGYEPATPPDRLYHGTGHRNVAAILRDGLKRMQRHHVHLSADPHTARTVGTRHGRPVVLIVDAARMSAEGHTFFRSANGVWLTQFVPPDYLSTA